MSLLSRLHLLLCWVAFITYRSAAAHALPNLKQEWTGRDMDCEPISTTSGRYIGHSSKLKSNITEYLGIRYAQPATGDLRFAAPVAFTSNDTFHASTEPDDCPYVAQPWGDVPGELYTHAPRIMAQESADGYNAMSEDCLALNIWTPTQQGNVPVPVMVFLYGGGFERGSINNPAYNGASMAANENVIVVSFNFRVNIVGFANAPGSPTNVALRDVRLALEWVRTNIVAFGGDVDRITMFGQSQGAYLISYYAYAYPNDPIASSFIQQSGSAFSNVTQSQADKSIIWRNVSSHAGCGQGADSAVLQCMRRQDLSTILGAMFAQPQPSLQSPAFGPVIDNELIFDDYVTKTLSNDFAQKPFLVGSNDNEAAFYVMRYATEYLLNQTEQDEIGYGLFVCPTAVDAASKAVAFQNESIPIYRYEYFGDWPNLRLYPGSRAYHTSETSMVFGNMEAISGDPNTPLQVEVSRYLQHAWAEFARNPMEGLQALGWPTYNPEGKTLVRLGYGQESEASSVTPYGYDSVCKTLKKH